MQHPFEQFRIIGNPSFIKNIDVEFYTKHYNTLNKGLNVVIDKTKEGMYVHGFDTEAGEFSAFITIYTFFEQEYNKLESKARLLIDKIILENLDEQKQNVFIKSLVAELQLLQIAITNFEFSNTNEKLKNILSERVKSFIQILGNIYLNTTSLGNSSKIQWLGNTNVLATLVYDLWRGQEKGKNETSTKPLIKADKKDLESLLINNFIDKSGKSLTVSTVSDYLSSNVEKAMKRAKKGIRIELLY